MHIPGRSCSETPDRKIHNVRICLASHFSRTEPDSNLPPWVTAYVPSAFLGNSQILRFIEPISTHGYSSMRWVSLQPHRILQSNNDNGFESVGHHDLLIVGDDLRGRATEQE